MKKLEEVVKEKDEDKLWVSSVPETNNYYERQGFKLVCEGKVAGDRLRYFLVKDL